MVKFLPNKPKTETRKCNEKAGFRMARKNNKEGMVSHLNFVTLRYGILTLKTSDSFFRSFCFLRQNEMFSAAEQNQMRNHSFFFYYLRGNPNRRILVLSLR